MQSASRSQFVSFKIETHTIEQLSIPAEPLETTLLPCLHGHLM